MLWRPLRTPERPVQGGRHAFESAGPAVQSSWMLAAMTDKAGSGYWFLPAPTVEAGWLLLRQPEPGDSSALHDAVTASSEHLRPWMPWAANYTAEMAREFVQRNAGVRAPPEAKSVEVRAARYG